MRQLAAWEQKKPDLDRLGCRIYAVSADQITHAKSTLNSGITFDIGYGCTKADAETIGAWWGNHPPDGQHIEPTEFLIGRGGIILGSMYASGPVGRMSVEEAIALISEREERIP
jgi:peroxiredoxin